MKDLAKIVNHNGLSEIREKPIRLDYREIIHHFGMAGNVGVVAYLRDSRYLDNNAKAVVLFLRDVFNDSIETIKTYAILLCQILNHVGKYVRDIEPQDLSEFVDTLRRAGQAANTINTKIACAKAFFRFLVREQIIPADPAWRLKRVKGRKAPGHHEKILSEEDFRSIIDQVKREGSIRDAVLLEVLFFTGVRAVEVTRLTWSDLKCDVSGKRWFAMVQGKGSKVRDVYLPRFVIDSLMRLRRDLFQVEVYRSAPALDDLPVFAHERNPGRSLGRFSVYRLVADWSQRALGRKISPHWARHTFATHAAKRGASLTLIRDQLGHASVKTTEIYEGSRHLRGECAGMVFDILGRNAGPGYVPHEDINAVGEDDPSLP